MAKRQRLNPPADAESRGPNTIPAIKILEDQRTARQNGNTQNLLTPEASSQSHQDDGNASASSQMSVVIDGGASSEDDDDQVSADMSDRESSEDDDDSLEDSGETSEDDSDSEVKYSQGGQNGNNVIDLTGEDEVDAGGDYASNLPGKINRIVAESEMMGIDVRGIGRQNRGIFPNSPRPSQMSYRPSERLSMGPPRNPATRKEMGSSSGRSSSTQSESSHEDDDNGDRPADHLRPFPYRMNYGESPSSAAEELMPSIKKDSQGGARKIKNGEVYDVREIIGEHSVPGKHEFLVRWVDFEKPDWVKAENCCCPELINHYRNQRENPVPESSDDSDGSSVVEVKVFSFGGIRKNPQRRPESTARFSRAVSILGDERLRHETRLEFQAAVKAVEGSQPMNKRKRAKQVGDAENMHSAKQSKEAKQILKPGRKISSATLQASTSTESVRSRASQEKGMSSRSTPVDIVQKPQLLYGGPNIPARTTSAESTWGNTDDMSVPKKSRISVLNPATKVIQTQQRAGSKPNPLRGKPQDIFPPTKSCEPHSKGRFPSVKPPQDNNALTGKEVRDIWDEPGKQSRLFVYDPPLKTGELTRSSSSTRIPHHPQPSSVFRAQSGQQKRPKMAEGVFKSTSKEPSQECTHVPRGQAYRCQICAE